MCYASKMFQPCQRFCELRRNFSLLIQNSTSFLVQLMHILCDSRRISVT
uniref:Uncharacterized protein n=1 Tax=Anguilla anguilla TaxID=7936 RepID=A0A0E9R6Z9_ANGAN